MAFHNIALTIGDFENANWEEVVAQSASKECYSYAAGFIRKANEAAKADNTKRTEIFAVLIAATDARLDVHHQPGGDLFIPFPIWRDGKPSLVPDDIPDMHLDVLRELAPTITDPEMRARITDILWTRRRDHKMAALAVDAYLDSARALEFPVSWLEGRDRAFRALQIATQLGRNSPHIKNVVAYIDDLIDRAIGRQPVLLPARMMNVLLAGGQGDPVKYAAIAHTAATEAEARHDWEIARDYWKIEAQWHAQNKDPHAERAANLRAAETYVLLAADYAHASPSDYLSATTQLERAIEAYRSVGRTKERVEELRETLEYYQQKSMPQMQSHSVEMPGVKESAEEAMDYVKGKSLQEAIQRLALIHHPPSTDSLRDIAQESAKDDFLGLLASRAIVDDQGRTVARETGSSPERADDEALEPEMVRVAQMYRDYITKARIVPAWHQVTIEHYFTLESLIPVVSDRPLVPPGHEEFFARGLLAGFRGDFLVATHLLVPQIEQSIRYLLTLFGVIPYGLDDNMIQDAYLLDAVLRRPETTSILGEEIVFDLKTLLVSRFGSNLRNRLSHGLMKAPQFYGTASVYLWWLVLHLCYASFIRRERQESAEQR